MDYRQGISGLNPCTGRSEWLYVLLCKASVPRVLWRSCSVVAMLENKGAHSANCSQINKYHCVGGVWLLSPFCSMRSVFLWCLKLMFWGSICFSCSRLKKTNHARPDALSSCIGQLVLFDNFQLVLSFTFLRVRKIIHIVLSVVSWEIAVDEFWRRGVVKAGHDAKSITVFVVDSLVMETSSTVHWLNRTLHRLCTMELAGYKCLVWLIRIFALRPFPIIHPIMVSNHQWNLAANYWKLHSLKHPFCKPHFSIRCWCVIMHGIIP